MFDDIKVNLKNRYRTTVDDVVNDFYVPVLSESVKYDRAVGYFSSAVLLTYIEGLESFLDNNGKMRLLISPFVSQSDEEALFFSVNSDEMMKESLNELFSSYHSKNNKTNIAAQILCKLIEERVLEIRVVVPKNKNGLFHEKVAIFYDSCGDIIGTEGSNNETGSALTENLEAFVVFKQSKLGQEEYINEFRQDFEGTWNDELEKYRTISLENAVSKEILSTYKSEETVENLYNRLKNRIGEDSSRDRDDEDSDLSFTPYDYQVQAAEKWIDKKKGIISFATGTGKTKTAVYAIDQLIKKHDENVFVIVVPDKTLVNQWADNDLSENWNNIIKCFSENGNWRRQLREQVNFYNSGLTKEPLLVVTTIDTFKLNKKKSDFQKQMQRLNGEYVFIVDECHRFGTDSGLTSLPIQVERRLGLSATPEIYMSPDRTERLFDYFGGIIAEYPLKKAIDNHQLTPYEYHPVIVHLEDSEKEKYRDLTHKIIQICGDVDENSWEGLSPQAEMLLFQRARVVYGANEKMEKLAELLEQVQNKRNMLIYCGATSIVADNSAVEQENENLSIRQIDTVISKLQSQGLKTVRYTSHESGEERKDRIRWFKEGTADVIVAIKALDEGVDIPQIDTGIILASSGNPREFVQRRGRMLRKYKGKEKAVIFDMVVLDDEFPGMKKSEIKRVYEFSKDAKNYTELMDQFGSEFEQFSEENVDNE